MCGIAGLLNFDLTNIDFLAVLEKLQHRGPDASGEYYSPDKRLALGHRRLSIIDLSQAADQPFRKDEWVLSYNGELYNYQELKQDLQALGAQFQTTSDTEVLLEAWRHWGAGCLTRLRGMFVFAIYNEQTKQLFLARDPYGIKPLFIAQQGRQLAFASELKALTGLMTNSAINYEGLVASLLYVWLPDSQTMYQGVEKFPAGHWSEVKQDGSLIMHCYYDFTQELNQPVHHVTVDELENCLLESIEKHLVSDVPVSAFLSGGLDSSLITAMAKHYKDDIDAYTIAFTSQDQRFEAMPDDAKYARQVAEYLGVNLQTIELSPDIVDSLPQMVRMLDEPIGDAATLNTFLICQAARQQGVKVLLSGMGADEIFAGYRKHYACLLAAQYRRYLPGWLRKRVLQPFIENLPVAGKNKGYRTLRWAQRFTRFANLPEEPGFLRSYTYYSPQQLRALLNPELHQFIDPLLKEHADLYWQGPENDQINRMCFTDVQLFMRGLNLTYTDRASMAASTEVRVPFIDKELIKLAFQMPGWQKLRGKTSKYLLKQVAEKWLPKDIIYRPKAGFAAPLRSWIRHDLASLIDEQILSNQGLAGRGLFNKNYLKQMVLTDRAGKADYSQQIWQFLTLETWLRQQGIK